MQFRTGVIQQCTNNKKKMADGLHPAVSQTKKLLRSNWHLSEVAGSFVPGGRESATLDWINDNLYVFGGLEMGSRSQSLLKFDTSTHRWYEYPNLENAPQPRCSHSSWVIGNKLFIFAGEGKGLNSTDKMTEEEKGYFGTEEKYSVKSSDVFKEPKEIRGIRRICFDNIVCFDTEEETWTPIRSGLSPLPRKGHSSVIVGENPKDATLVIFGGAPSGTGRPMNDLHTVGTANLIDGVAMWSKKKPSGPSPSPRYGHACVSVSASAEILSGSITGNAIGSKGCMILFGGTAGTGELFNDVHMYDIEANDWQPLVCQGQIPAPRYGHSAQIIPHSTSQNAGLDEPLLVTYGGVMRNGTENSFSRDLHILHLKNRHWTLVKTSHLFPSPRYGHTIVLNPNIKPWYHGVPLPPKPDDRHESKEMIAKRDAYQQFQVGTGDAVSFGTMFLFGGLNSMYCSGELWTGWLEMRNPGGQFAFTGNMNPKPQRLGKAAAMIEQLENVVMAEKKQRLKADALLMREKDAKLRVQDEAKELRDTIATLRTEKREMEEQYKEEMENLMFKYEEEQKRCVKLRTELREAHNLLCLVDLSSNLRLQVWQSRAKDAEKRISENPRMLSESEGKGGREKSKTSNNNNNNNNNNIDEEGSEISSQYSSIVEEESRVEDDNEGKIDAGNSDIVFNNRKSKSRRFNRGGILLDEDSSKDARGFPVWDDDEE